MDLLDNMADEIETCWVIGGSSVYAESLKSSQLNSLYITKIHQAIAILEFKAMLWLGILKGCGSAIHLA